MVTINKLQKYTMMLIMLIPNILITILAIIAVIHIRVMVRANTMNLSLEKLEKAKRRR